MSEHHTQGRQGQGARHHRRYRSNRNYRHRMPRAEESSSQKKPSFLKRVLAFFGFGKKANAAQKQDRKKDRAGKGNGQQPPQRVRVAQTKNASRNGATPAKGRRRAASVPPTEQARLYVGNLSFEATESELEDLFKGFGHVRSVEIIYNTRTYRSKGYAFVEMEQLGDAQRAAEVLHGQPFMGRELMVSAASEKMERNNSETPAAPKPAAEPVKHEDELEANFGEEVVVPLGQAANFSQEVKEPEAPAAEEKPADAPAAEESKA